MNTHPAVEYFESRRSYYQGMIAFRLNFNDVDIDEVMHLAQIALWKGWGQAAPETLQGWANQVVFNVILEFKRSKRHIKNSCYTPMDIFAVLYPDGSVAQEPADFITALHDHRDAHHILETTQAARVIIDAIKRSKCPVLTRLALGEGPARISRELKITIPAAKSRIYKFRQRMAKRLGVNLEKENEVSRSALAA